MPRGTYVADLTILLTSNRCQDWRANDKGRCLALRIMSPSYLHLTMPLRAELGRACACLADLCPWVSRHRMLTTTTRPSTARTHTPTHVAMVLMGAPGNHDVQAAFGRRSHYGAARSRPPSSGPWQITFSSGPGRAQQENASRACACVARCSRCVCSNRHGKAAFGPTASGSGVCMTTAIAKASSERALDRRRHAGSALCLTAATKERELGGPAHLDDGRRASDVRNRGS
jgi:hypothetical protein